MINITTTLKNKHRTLLFLLPAILVVVAQLVAQPTVSFTPVIRHLHSPMQVVSAGDGSNRLFVVEKEGAIRVYQHNYDSTGVFLKVSDIATKSEKGLLSMVFHPAYQVNGFFFVCYTGNNGNLEIARYKVSADANKADESSKKIVLSIPLPNLPGGNHTGGDLQFGKDGYLYLSTGDGGNENSISAAAQDINLLLGKILRIDVNSSEEAPFYRIPADNPFGSEVYDIGLRNPFRWSFDSETGDMWIGDVGQLLWEEINYRAASATAGVNYGWRCYEGNTPYNTDGCGPSSGYVFPIFTYANQRPAAVTGGVVYHGTSSPLLKGYYVAADFYSGDVFTIYPVKQTQWNSNTQKGGPKGIIDFGEAENKEVFAVSLQDNVIYKVSADGSLPVTLIKFTGAIINKQAVLNWITSYEKNTRQFDVEYSTDGRNFITAGTVTAKNNLQGSAYTFSQLPPASGDIFYRLKMVDRDGHSTMSGIIQLNRQLKSSFVYPSIINNKVVSVFVNDAFSSVEIISADGRLIASRNIEGNLGRIDVMVNSAAAGTYLVRLKSRNKTITQRVIIAR